MTASGISCVIGDDHPVLRAGMTEYLRSVHGIQIAGTAGDGNATLALVLSRRPQVLVVDAAMPGLSGVAVCREVTAQAPHTAVVVFTGTDDIALLDAALDAGACGFVLKSGPPQCLADAVVAAAAGESYVEPVLAAALLRRRSATPLLSRRESEVLALLAEGQTTEEAGRTLFLSPATIRTYAENAMHKVEARNRVHLVAKSIRMGLLN